MYHLFDVYGIELEYMIVRKDTMKVYPICDEIIKEVAGDVLLEVERGDIAWSNELALHVIELKTNGPAKSLDGLADKFHNNITEINRILAEKNAMLLPTGMHPFMKPADETTLWPHGQREIYNAYDRIFQCGGHGWANVQSTHINLPFAGDDEFGRLHAAIRAVLPLLPAIAASTPYQEGQASGSIDTRLTHYRSNQKRIPSITGHVIPEAVFTEKDYRDNIFAPMYKDIAPLDPEGILQDEWLNSRGAIARFDRGAIEIRLLDIQESPRADIAVVNAVITVLKALAAERWVSLDKLMSLDTLMLERLYESAVTLGADTTVSDSLFLSCFGLKETASMERIWHHLAESLDMGIDSCRIIESGTLSSRLLACLGDEPSREEITAVYRRLAECLAGNRLFSCE